MRSDRMKTDLTTIPYVGKTTEQDFIKMGITCIEDLKGKDPEELYFQDCILRGYPIDRCQLYVFRMAVYYAENIQKNTLEEEKLKWWYWKDTN